MTDISRSYQQELHRRAYPPLDEASMEALKGPVREQGRVEAGLLEKQNPKPEIATVGDLARAPLDAGAATLKGAAQAWAGTPGDLDELAGMFATFIAQQLGAEGELRGPFHALTGMKPPTTEQIGKFLTDWLGPVVPGATSKMEEGLKGAETAGEFLGPGGHVRAARGAVKGAIKAVGKSKAAASGVGAAAAGDAAK